MTITSVLSSVRVGRPNPRACVSRLAGALAVLVLGTMLYASSALAVHVQCGELVTHDVKLDSDLTNCPGDGLIIGADGVTVDLNGHTISGTPGPTTDPDGVDNGAGHDHLTVARGRISGFPGDGVFLDGGANGASLRSLTVTGNGVGIEVIASRGAVLMHDDISDNQYLGIIVRDSRHSAFAHNRIAANGSGGVLMSNSADNRFEENEVVSNPNAGLQIQESDHNRFAKNEVRDNPAALFFAGGARNRIEKNVVSGAGDFVPAVFIDGGDGNEITKNVVFDNGNAGIGILGDAFFEDFAENNLVSKNEVRDNELGIATRAAKGTVIERNTANHNTSHGIKVNDSNTTIAKNRANDNGQLGIDAVPGVVDGGGNRAAGNGNPLQCLNVLCK